MLLYADEDFSFPVVEELRRRGHVLRQVRPIILMVSVRRSLIILQAGEQIRFSFLEMADGVDIAWPGKHRIDDYNHLPGATMIKASGRTVAVDNVDGILPCEFFGVQMFFPSPAANASLTATLKPLSSFDAAWSPGL